MVRALTLIILLSACYYLPGQISDYPADKIKLLSISNPNKDSLPPGAQKYSGCWGWYQEDKHKEYALIGGVNGTYFIDITDPKAPVVRDYVGGQYCILREIKTFKNYCYVTNQCSEGLKIIDMQYLPDSVHVVSTGTNVLRNCHTIWISDAKLYCASLVINNTNLQVGVFSLSNPEFPIFLHSVASDYSFATAHDMYSRRDTVYFSGGNGIQVFKYDSLQNKFIILGTYSNYSKQGYCHSNYLTENGKYLVFCDEVPAAIPIHIVDVSNLQNIQPVSEFLPGPYTTPHNPYVIGNDWAIISCYEDGLRIYDIRDPYHPKQAGFFDTYCWSGIDQGYYTGEYVGNWGAYPFLPSRTIIALDMQNGAFFLDAREAYGIETLTNDSLKDCLSITTIPTSLSLTIKAKTEGDGIISLFTPEGKPLFSKTFSGRIIETISTELLPNGFYILKVETRECSSTKKILVTHK